MRWIRGIWYTLVWLKEWQRFSFHYMLTWGMPASGSREDLRQLEEQMASGPMRFEYERVELLKQRAKEEFCGPAEREVA